MRITNPIHIFAAALLAVGLTACSGDSTAPTKAPDKEVAVTYDLEVPMVEYTWDANAGDTSVSADMGGPGFTGEGWTTNLKFPALGSSKAVKGGQLVLALGDWPSTLRLAGKESNNIFSGMTGDLLNETLVSLHPITKEFIPRVATHWHISDDKKTYKFRINPEAKWSDGTPITAEDVVATWSLRMNPDIMDPSGIMVFGKLNKPVAISKYIVEVSVKQENWRNFLYFGAGLELYPAAHINIPGADYLDKFQNAYHPLSAPYEVKAEDIDMGKSITLTLRDDWWGKDNPANQGMYNIGKIRYDVVKDPGLTFEKLKKGEIEYWAIPKAQWWAEELPKVDAFKRGLLVGQKHYNEAPIGTSGLAINMRREPLNDKRVRLALQLLSDRKTMIKKLFYNEYAPLNSYFQGSAAHNPNNVMHEYDELRAVELLAEAGWTEKNDEGYRVKDGKELELTLQYRSALSERSLTIFQESCKRAGIRINLQLLTPAAAWKNMMNREFDLASTAWTGLSFPNPETSYHSKLADQANNNNITGFSNARMDALCDAYDAEYDVAKRNEILQEIDGIVYEEVPYVLEWYNPSQRIVYWNKLAMPEWGSLASARASQLFYIWWIDPEKDAALTAAKSDAAATLPIPPKHVRFWSAWREANPTKEAPSQPEEAAPETPDAEEVK